MNENVIQSIISDLHEKYKTVNDGALADYIPELTRANPDWFGICIVTSDGHVYQVGDSSIAFTIQSVSKAFTYGMILDKLGLEKVEQRIGVEPSGEAFNSISLDPETGRPLNPMINAGAIAASGMVSGENLDDRFENIRERFSQFAGAELGIDNDVYQSESATGFRNRAIANLLRNFDMLDDPVDEAVEVYFKQCSILVNCLQLAVMASSLANGGVNPLTGEQVLKHENVEKVLSVMSTCGMYDYSGEWIFSVGLPAKSGVGGGVMGVLPGQLGVAVFSPLLDTKGNSVRGVKTFKELSRKFELHLFNYPALSGTMIRRIYRLSDVGSQRQRPKHHHEAILENGGKVVVIEMQGDLFYSAMERFIRATTSMGDSASTIVLDLGRVSLTDRSSRDLLIRVAQSLKASGNRLVVIDPSHLFVREEFSSESCDVRFFDDLDIALEQSENQIIEETVDAPLVSGIVAFHEFDIFNGLTSKELSHVEGVLGMCGFQKGKNIVKQGDDADKIYLLAKGSVSISHRSEREELKSQRIAAFDPGVCFGEMAAIDRSPRSVDVWADEDSACYTLDMECFNQLESENPDIYSKVLKNILLMNMDRLRQATREISSLKQ